MNRFVILTFLAVSATHAWAGVSREGLRNAADRVTAGRQHSCAIREDGRVFCWGANTQGQLANGTRTQQLTPVKAINAPSALGISAGGVHTCFVAIGTRNLFCLGGNNRGQLGNGTKSDFANVDLVGVIAVAAGSEHTCALTSSGSVHCWGDNTFGQLGDGTNVPRPKPVPVVTSGGPLTRITALGAGTTHTCAVSENGEVFCWGGNQYGQLGLGNANPTNRAVAVPNVASVSNIALGQLHTCALRADGTIRCWGRNNQGQLGNGTTVDALSAIQPATGAANIKGLSAGDSHTCVLRATGTVECFGDNQFGQLGDGTATPRLTPVSVQGLTAVIQVASGGGHNCAIGVDDTVRCWGENTNGAVGDGTLTDRSVPVVVLSAGTISARTATTGHNHSCAVRASGAVACWGRNDGGQLGDNTTTRRLSPVPVSGLTNAVMVSGGSAHTCALRANGGAHCWGNNQDGQLGDNTTSSRPAPAAVSGLTNAVAVSAGVNFSCALKANGFVQCWGSNSHGQLGANVAVKSLVPVDVTGLNTAVMLSSKSLHSCAVRANGAVLCWGSNRSGQLGDGTQSDARSFPAPVAGLIDAVMVAAGNSHTCALRVNGSVVCWGSNFEGQLGDNTTTNRLTPVTVNGVTDAIMITAGVDYTCALRASGFAKCWGENRRGQLGINSTDSPVMAPATLGGNFVGGLSADSEHTCGIGPQRELKCWGINIEGEIGDGTTTDRLRPTDVPSFLFNISPRVTLLNNNGRSAQVFALANCAEGASVLIDVILSQQGISGRGRAQGECTGSLKAYPVDIRADGDKRFVFGVATALAEADIWQHGSKIGDQRWTARVLIGQN